MLLVFVLPALFLCESPGINAVDLRTKLYVSAGTVSKADVVEMLLEIENKSNQEIEVIHGKQLHIEWFARGVAPPEMPSRPAVLDADHPLQVVVEIAYPELRRVGGWGPNGKSTNVIEKCPANKTAFIHLELPADRLQNGHAFISVRLAQAIDTTVTNVVRTQRIEIVKID